MHESGSALAADALTSVKHVLLPITDRNPYLSEGTRQVIFIFCFPCVQLMLASMSYFSRIAIKRQPKKAQPSANDSYQCGASVGLMNTVSLLHFERLILLSTRLLRSKLTILERFSLIFLKNSCEVIMEKPMPILFPNNYHAAEYYR